jgi:hypothetical protein
MNQSIMVQPNFKTVNSIDRIHSKVASPQESVLNEAYENRVISSFSKCNSILQSYGFYNKSKILVQPIGSIKTNLMPGAISNYIGNQLILPISSRNLSFKNGLSTGISKMVKNTVIKDSKILGMKIVCKGR